MNYPRSIGDGYPEYLDDELGYHYHAWEVISASESTRHQAIQLGADPYLDSLEANLGALSDLELWALARRRLHQQNKASYFKLVTAIANGPMQHRAIDYPEVLADLSRRLAEDSKLDDAARWADEIKQRWPELAPTIPLLKAHHLLSAKRIEDAETAYNLAIDALADDAPETRVDLLIEAAEDFLHASAPEQAQLFLDRAQRAAQEAHDEPSLVDIELLRRALAELLPHQS